jgi:hypothetical protein
MQKLLAPLIVLFIAAASPVWSAEDRALPPDQVVLDLVAEDWVETETARLMVQVTAAIAGDQVGELRGDIMKALEQLAPGAEWHITGFHRNRDRTGLERATAAAEARVKEADIGDVNEKARTLSRPGMQVAVRGIDFSPTLAEREAVAASLRAKIYTRVREEMQRLGRIHEGRSFRLRLVDFSGVAGLPEVRPMLARKMAADAGTTMQAQPVPAGVNVSQRVSLRARVILATD